MRTNKWTIHRHTYKLWVILVLAGVFALGGCSLLPNEQEPLKPPLAKPVQEKMVLVEVVKKEITNQIKGTAVFEPARISYEQFTESGGVVAEVLVASGAEVKKGDVLVRLDNDGLDVSYKEAQLDVERKKLALRQAVISQDEAMIAIRALEMEIAQMKLDKASTAYFSKELVASMDGVVIYVADLKPGDRVQAYRALVNIADTSTLRLYYRSNRPNVLVEVQVGMDVHVTFSQETMVGKVVQTPASASPALNDQIAEKDRQGIYMTTAALPQGASFGDNAQIQIVLQHKEEALVIPRGSLRSYLGRNYVQLMEGESRIEQDVMLGIQSDTEVEVLEGLQEGQSVIMR